MKEWTYKELRESINEEIEEYENDKDLNYTKGQIANRCFYECTVVINQGYTESLIVHTTIGKYIIEKCSKDTIINYRNEIHGVLKQYDRSKLDSSLTDEEMKEIEYEINYVLSKMESIV